MPYEEQVIENEEAVDDGLPFAEEEGGADEKGADSAQESVHQLVSRNEGEERTPEELEADIRQIEALAQLDPAIREMPEYKNLLETFEKVKGDEGEEDESDEGEPIPKENVEDKVEEDEEEKEEEGEDDEEEEPDVFGITSKKGAKKKESVDVEIDGELKEFIEKNYSIKDADTFFSSVDKWRNDSQELSKVSQEYEDISEGLQSLPQPIKDAITAFSNAEDYHSAFMNSGGRLNYELDFEEQDKESLVQHYFSKKLEKLESRLEDGDIDEDDYDDRVNDLYDSAERLYNTDKKEYEKQRADLIDQQKRELQSFKQSANSSVELLKKTYPDFSKANLQRVKQRLVNGEIDSLFQNKDGTYKEEAAEMLAMAMFGKDVIQKLIEKAEYKGASKANEEIVRKGDKKPKKTSKSQTQRKEVEAMDAISHLNSQFVKDPYS